MLRLRHRKENSIGVNMNIIEIDVEDLFSRQEEVVEMLTKRAYSNVQLKCPKCGKTMGWNDWNFQYECAECDEILSISEPDWE